MVNKYQKQKSRLAIVKGVVLILILGIAAQQALAAAQIFSTGFEEPSTASITSVYIDTTCTDHALANQATMPLVTHPNTSDGTGASELGFTSAWTDTRSLCPAGPSGLSDGDAVGVVDILNSPSPIAIDTAAYAGHGQLFAVEDPDGRVSVRIQGVTCGAGASITASADYYVNSTTYESTDEMRIWVEIDGVPTDLINISSSASVPTNMDAFFDLGPGVEDAWQSVSAGPIVGNTAVLNFFADTNAAAEEVMFDNLQIDCGAPTAVSLQNFSTASSPPIALIVTLFLAGMVVPTLFVFWRRKEA